MSHSAARNCSYWEQTCSWRNSAKFRYEELRSVDWCPCKFTDRAIMRTVNMRKVQIVSSCLEWRRFRFWIWRTKEGSHSWVYRVSPSAVFYGNKFQFFTVNNNIVPNKLVLCNEYNKTKTHKDLLVNALKNRTMVFGLSNHICGLSRPLTNYLNV